MALVGAVAAMGWYEGRKSSLPGSVAEKGPRQTIQCRVNGGSMLPTFHDGQTVHIQPEVAAYRLGDVVAVNWQGKLRIKRIAGLPGDVIQLADERLLNNGLGISDRIFSDDEPLFPPLSVGGREAGNPIEFQESSRSRRRRYPITVGEDQLFLVGDHVSVSIDSRQLGPAPIRSVIGVVVVD